MTAPKHPEDKTSAHGPLTGSKPHENPPKRDHIGPGPGEFADQELHDERLDADNPDHARGRDKRTGDIPGTPWTPPEGHDERQPGPGEPGGPSTSGVKDEDSERHDAEAADRDKDKGKDR